MIRGLIKRSIEIITNQGIREYAKAVNRYILWHPVLDEVRWYTSRLLRSQYQIVEVTHGNKILIDNSFGGVNRHLYLFGCYEPESTKIFSEIIPQNATVVDIGANIGYYALIEAAKAQKVYAIEPEPNNIELLRKNIALNSFENVVEVYQCAISDKTGKALFIISDTPNQHRLQVSGVVKPEKSIEVVTITLDEFLEDKDVDVVRMDLVGAEWLVVNGMKNLLSEEKPMILFLEVHPELITYYGGDIPTMLDLLFESGFKASYLGVPIFKQTPFSLKNYITLDSTRMRMVNFDPPADKYKLNMHIGQIVDKNHPYHIFLIKS
jgi:FkbM family methyltransferase